MQFTNKYTSISKKEDSKTQLSEEAYAIGELLQELIYELKRGIAILR